MNYRICFAAYLRRQEKSPATIRNYIYALADFMDYCRRAGKRGSLLKSFQPRHLEAYKEFLLKNRGLRPSTVNQRLTALSAFARFLISRELLAYNPLEAVARVNNDGKNKKQPQATWEQVQQLRREVHKNMMDFPGRPIIELLYTGISVRELCSLRWDGQAISDRMYVETHTIRLHPEAQLALEHYRPLRRIQLGSYLIVGEAVDWSLKPSAVYALMKRLSRKIKSQVAVRDLRLAQFALTPGSLSPVPREIAA